MGFGKLAFMCPQNRCGELSQPCSQAVRRAAAQQEGALTTGSFPPEDQAQHLPRQYTEILQKWKGGSKLLFPLQKHRKLSLLQTQIHGKEDKHMGTMLLTFLLKSRGALPAPFGDWAHIAKQAPRIPPRAVDSCILAALQRSNPARSRIAKSPTYENQEPTVNEHSQSEVTLNRTIASGLFLTFHISSLPESFQRDKKT